MFLWVGLQSDSTGPARGVGLKSDPRGRYARVLWVGLQSDSTRSASRVGLKSDPQGAAGDVFVGRTSVRQPHALSQPSRTKVRPTGAAGDVFCGSDFSPTTRAQPPSRTKVRPTGAPRTHRGQAFQPAACLSLLTLLSLRFWAMVQACQEKLSSVRF